MKIKVGIVGYGNLGKAVAKEIQKREDLELIAIFSRRTNIESELEIEKYSNILDYKDKIDVLLLCGGSQKDLLEQTPNIIKHFNCINSFDTHALIRTEKEKINKLAVKNEKTALISCGWDPGLMSLIRMLAVSIFKTLPKTSWGKGVSMGHSEILRRIDGVKYAVQYTIPQYHKKSIYNQVVHKRLCVIVADPENRKKIIDTILSIPNYYKEQNVKIKFVSEKVFLKKHIFFYHAGRIFYKDKENYFNFEVKMKSNPDFTAKILLSYCSAIKKFVDEKKYGCFTVDDIPFSYFCDSIKYM